MFIIVIKPAGIVLEPYESFIALAAQHALRFSFDPSRHPMSCSLHESCLGTRGLLDRARERHKERPGKLRMVVVPTRCARWKYAHAECSFRVGRAPRFA